jgi:hypothetical protein
MRRLLITIDGGPNDRDSLRSAVTLATMTGGGLSVAHPLSDSRRALGFGETMLVVDESAESDGRARAAFDEVAAGLPGARFQAYQATAGELVAWQGPGHDLILVERVSREEGPEAELLNIALFETGRPVLLLPPQPRTLPSRARSSPGTAAR